MIRPARFFTLGLVLFLTLFPCFTRAHRQEFPKRDELLVEPRRVTLTIKYLIPSTEESELLRHLFDRDRSGSLEESEQKALLSHLGVQATAFLKLTLDGQPIPLTRERAELSPANDRQSVLAVVLTLTAPLALGAGRHHLRLFDRHKDRHLVVPLRLSTPGLRLLSPLPPLPLLDDTHPLDFDLAVL